MKRLAISLLAVFTLPGAAHACDDHGLRYMALSFLTQNHPPEVEKPRAETERANTGAGASTVSSDAAPAEQVSETAEQSDAAPTDRIITRLL